MDIFGYQKFKFIETGYHTNYPDLIYIGKHYFICVINEYRCGKKIMSRINREKYIFEKKEFIYNEYHCHIRREKIF